MNESENILGFYVNKKSADTCTKEICDWVELKSEDPHKPAGKYVACLNAHSLNVSRNDEHFKRALKSANLLVPDGSGILLASKIFGGNIRQRVTGDDIFQGVMDTLNRRGKYKVYFLGSTDQTLEKIQVRATKEFKNLTVCGVYSPAFKQSYSTVEINEMIQAINEAKPDILWVGLTAPKQEKWLYDNIDKLNVRFAGAIGAVFDFYAENVPRAPKLIQNIGMEWLYRVYRQPRKLGMRYLKSNPVFIGLLLRTYIVSKISK